MYQLAAVSTDNWPVTIAMLLIGTAIGTFAILRERRK